jgi:hypothetical protein
LSGDEISLTLPADEAFHRVAYLVLGGLAVRLDLTFEHLEDLELALDALLGRRSGEGEMTMRVQLLDGELRTTVGPFSAVRADLDRGGTDALNLSRILGAVCDSVSITDDGGFEWVQLTKRMRALESAGG